MRKKLTLFVVLSALSTLALADSGSPPAYVPVGIPTQGYLLDSTSKPVTQRGMSITFALYDAPTGGNVKWTETRQTDVDGGFYALTLGDPAVQGTTPLTPDALTPPLYLGVTIENGQEMTPRFAVATVPFSLRASAAQNVVGGGTVDTTSVSIGGTQVIDSNGQFLGTAHDAENLGGQPAADFLTKTGDGSGLTNLNPGNIAQGTAAIDISGTAHDAENLGGQPAADFLTKTGDGSGLTNLNPANLASGTAAINIAGNAATATAAQGFTGALSGDVTGTQAATLVGGLQGVPIAITAPTATDVLRYDGTAKTWVPSGDVASFAGRTGAVMPQAGDYSFDQIVGTVGNLQLDGPVVTALSSGAGLTVTTANPNAVGAAEVDLSLNQNGTLATSANGLSVNLANTNTWTGTQAFDSGATVSNGSDKTSLTVVQTSVDGPTADVFDVTNRSGSKKYISVDAAGDVSFSGNLTAKSVSGSTMTKTDLMSTLGAASGTNDGYLSSTDWTKLNGKLDSVSASAPLSGNGTASSPLSLVASSSSQDGYLSSGDWTKFNGKMGSVTNAPLTGSGTTSSPLSIAPATSNADGYLSSGDWTKFNGKMGSVTNAPLSGSGTTTSPLAMAQASGNADGYLSSGDWTKFNGKMGSVTSAPLTGSGTTTSPLAMAQASSSNDGYLSHTDWTTFNGKLATVTTNSTTPLSGSGTATSPLSIAKATSSTDGYLSSTDWTTFNGKLATVTTNSTTPLSGSGTTSSPLSIAKATSSTDGYLSSTDWTTFNGKVDRTGDTMTGALVVTPTADVVPLTLAASGGQSKNLTEWKDATGNVVGSVSPMGGASFSGTLSATTLNGNVAASELTGTIDNTQLTNSSVTISPASGSGLAGGGSVSLGGTLSSLAADIQHDSTLSGNGGSTALQLDLGNSNTWTAGQTFGAGATASGTTDQPSLVVAQTSAANPANDVFDVTNPGGGTKYVAVGPTGDVTLSGALTASTLTGAVATSELTGTIANTQLTNSSVTISPASGSGLAGGGSVSLGGTLSSLAADIQHDSTLSGNGGSTALQLDLGNSNTWTAGQMFGAGAAVSATADQPTFIVQQTSAVNPTANVFEVDNPAGNMGYFAIDHAGNAKFSGSVQAQSFQGNLPASDLTGSIANNQLANSSVTISPASGSGLTGGGSVSLGGALSSLAADIQHDSTLSGNGGSSALKLDLGNSNTWTAGQTFGGGATVSTTANAPALTVRQSSATGTNAAVFVVENASHSTDYLLVDATGNATFSGALSASSLSGSLAATNLTGQVAVFNGGTGATDAAGARTNLQAAQSGINSDITALNGLTTALAVTEGGTGLQSINTGDLLVGATGNTLSPLAGPTASGQVLRATGSGSFAWSAIAAGDLPTGIPSADLDHSSVTINAGVGLTGGGTVQLGGPAIGLAANLSHDSTLSGNGGTLSLGLNLAHANTWSATQTFTNATFTNPASGSISGNAHTVDNGVYTNTPNALTGALGLEPPGSTTVVPLTVNPGSGQTADLTDWQVNSTTVASVSAGGVLSAKGIALSNGAAANDVLTSDASGNATWSSTATLSGLTTSALALPTGAAVNDILTSDASGNGTWSSTATLSGLTLPTGAAAFDVLTSDASGNATWQPPSMFRTVQPVTSSNLVTISGADRGSLFEISSTLQDSATLQLPNPTTVGAGYSVTIKNESSVVAMVYPYGTEKIDGASFGLLTQTGYGTVVSDGTNWMIVGNMGASNTGEADFLTPGTYTWNVPPGVTNVSAVVVGAGGGGNGGIGTAGGGGGGGGLCYDATLTVTPGSQMVVDVGARGVNGGGGGQSDFGGATVYGGSGASGVTGGAGGGAIASGAWICYGGGNGGTTNSSTYGAGGGGAAGYGGWAGSGGSGSSTSCPPGGSSGGPGSGGGGGGSGSGASTPGVGFAGGGVGLNGTGAAGAGGSANCGSGGAAGGNGGLGTSFYGGGGPGRADVYILGRPYHMTYGVNGAVRIIWGPGRSYPSNAN